MQGRLPLRSVGLGRPRRQVGGFCGERAVRRCGTARRSTTQVNGKHLCGVTPTAREADRMAAGRTAAGAFLATARCRAESAAPCRPAPTPCPSQSTRRAPQSARDPVEQAIAPPVADHGVPSVSSPPGRTPSEQASERRGISFPEGRGRAPARRVPGCVPAVGRVRPRDSSAPDGRPPASAGRGRPSGRDPARARRRRREDPSGTGDEVSTSPSPREATSWPTWGP